MTEMAFDRVVLDALGDIAPEADMDTLRRNVPFRDQLDIDSMDFLNFVIAVNERTGIDIPESDYGALDTLDGCVAYLNAHSGTTG